jgi:hypothetical protein
MKIVMIMQAKLTAKPIRFWNVARMQPHAGAEEEVIPFAVTEAQLQASEMMGPKKVVEAAWARSGVHKPNATTRIESRVTSGRAEDVMFIDIGSSRY